MKIVLATSGSRGDVQPMLALALGFQERGHDVLLAGPPERAKWAEDIGCPYRPIGRDVTAFIDSVRSAHAPSMAVTFIRYVREEIRGQFNALPDIISGADLVVGASLCFGLASVAEAMGIAYRYIAFAPQMLPSAYHPYPAFKHQRLPAWCNRFGWWFVARADRGFSTRLINRHRRQLGLAPVKDLLHSYYGGKVVVASDPAISEIPPDTVSMAVQTGYMHLKQPTRELPALERFLADGPAPVYAGFGSMPRTDQIKLVPLFVHAARSAGRRIVIARPWGERSEPGADDVFYIRQYPYEHLFHRMAVVVHHGGAGTTATATASGVPQVIVPHILDQYFWGERVFRAGIGAKPIWRNHLTARKLGRAIRLCLRDTRMQETARKVRETIRLGDNGVEMTIEELLKGS
jgi:UDP:flavonoid glycosyltransferase YjiC (YdhE family)